MITFWKKMNGDTATRVDAQSRASSLLLALSNADSAMALQAMKTSEQGLTEVRVAHALKKYGKNEVAHEKPLPWYWMLLGNFKNPFVLVLLVIGAVSYLTNEMKSTIVVALMVGVTILMRFLQEFRSSQAAERLRTMVSTTATVTRQYHTILADGSIKPVSEKREILFEDLVPGDIVHLSAGDMIPADVRLLSSKDLFISQSVLTGEAMPSEKYNLLDTVIEKSASLTNGGVQGNPLERANLCFMGTTVVSGTGMAVVVNTAARTVFGSLASSVIGQRSLTSFDKGVNSVTLLLVRFMVVMVPVIFVLNGLVKGNWQEAFLFSLAVAVGLTPELLPMVVTMNLARGSLAMARQKVIVKRLNAVQNFGAMDILCTDKTGTLTQDKIILEQHLDIHGEESLRTLQLAYLNSYYQTGLKNLLDRAILQHVEIEHALSLSQSYTKIDEIPFDFMRRRMSVVVEKEHAQHLLICKGAVEEILQICSTVEETTACVSLTENFRKQALAVTQRLNEDGMRVIAVAYKAMSPLDRLYSVTDEHDLVLVGFVAFLDPPKDTAAEALAALKSHGVQVKILTGDNEIVTRRICREVGLSVEGVVLGNEIQHLTDAELDDLAERTTVFAKLAPLQKARIITALQHRGHTVGYLGDGINDAAALRDADVGISVDTATDIAKESADIILLEKNLGVLEAGALKGREVYGNIIKYIKMTTSSNFGNMFSVLTASAFIPFLPMLPIQILIQNLCYDISQLSLPWDRVDNEFLAEPRKWEPSGIARFMLFIGPISSIFDIVTFLVMWFVLQANAPEHHALFQSGWFVEGLLSQTLIVHMIRTQKIPFLQSTASLPVIVATGMIIAFGMYIPFSNLGAAVGMVPLPSSYFLWLAGILLAYSILTQWVKVWFIKRFQAWL